MVFYLSRQTDQNLGCVGFTDRDFLELRRLLTTDAIAGFERLDIADVAKVAHSIQLPAPNRVEPLDPECSVGLHRAFDLDLRVQEQEGRVAD